MEVMNLWTAKTPHTVNPWTAKTPTHSQDFQAFHHEFSFIYAKSLQAYYLIIPFSVVSNNQLAKIEVGYPDTNPHLVINHPLCFLYF